MKQLPAWRRYARFWGADPLRDVDDELAFHLVAKREELARRGVAAEQVEAEIDREFGDRHRIEAELKEIGMKRMQRNRRASLLDDVRVDLRHAWRAFLRRPAVPAVVVLTLGIAIGAGTAVFSLFDAVLLNPVAVTRPSELIVLGEGGTGLGFSYPMSKLLRERSTTTQGIAGYVATNVGLRGASGAEHLGAALVTGGYFEVLGLRPQHGRLLQPSDEGALDATPHAVLSDAVWRRMFGGDPAIVGRSVAINEVPYTVVGIAPPRFRGTSLAEPVDVWVPATMLATVGRSGLWASPNAMSTWFFSVFQHFARVSPDMPVERVAAELTALHNAAMKAAQEAEGPGLFSEDPLEPVSVTGFNEAAALQDREQLLRFLRLLGAAVAMALTIACVNVANLMLMRARERQRELSVRAAIGATRTRVARQLLLECSVLALCAGALGVGVALLMMKLLTTFSLPGGVALSEVSFPLDLRVLGFTVGISILCALGFGIAPAVTGARTDVMDALRGGHDAAAARRWHGGNIMVAAQVALSLVLLVAGALLLRSLQQALRVETGFRSEGVATLSVALRQHGYTAEQADIFMHEVFDHAARSGAVDGTAAGTRVPIDGDALRFPITAVGSGAKPRISIVPVSAGYLALMDIELLRGRDFERGDNADAPRVAIITRKAAARLWPDAEPLGRQFVVMFGEPYTVIGVAEDTHFSRLTEQDPQIFLSLPQASNLGGLDRLRIVGAGADAAAVLAALRAAVRAADPRLPTFQERNVTEQIAAVLMPQRFGSVLLSVFGMIALLISAVGIYAVASYDVTRRYRELGIRAALGARRRELVDAVLSRAGLAICAGIIVGLTLSAFAVQALRGLLFGITPWEPVSYLAAVMLLGMVAVLASWLPARRAARVDPLDVIKA